MEEKLWRNPSPNLCLLCFPTAAHIDIFEYTGKKIFEISSMNKGEDRA